jgi:hypothetical protein
MSSSIPTPLSARLPDSPTGYQYLVEKMRIASEWRPSNYIPLYQEGDVVFYGNNMYIKKNGNNNTPTLFPPNINVGDWISLESYIKTISSNHLGIFAIGNIPALDDYLNSITDVTDISLVNMAIVGYIITQHLGKGDGIYNFTLVANNPQTSNGYYFVNYSKTSSSYSTAISYGFKSPRNFFLSSANNATGTKNESTNVIQQLGYTPAKTDGTNWSSTAVATSLGYQPAKIGDSWISRKFYFNSGTGWAASDALASSPDLVNFTMFVPTSTSADNFIFGLQKGANRVSPDMYNVSVTPYLGAGPGVIGPSAFYLKPTSTIANYYTLSNANVFLVLGSSNTVTYQAVVVPFTFNITIYFSKNL